MTETCGVCRAARTIPNLGFWWMGRRATQDMVGRQEEMGFMVLRPESGLRHEHKKPGQVRKASKRTIRAALENGVGCSPWARLEMINNEARTVT